MIGCRRRRRRKLLEPLKVAGAELIKSAQNWKKHNYQYLIRLVVYFFSTWHLQDGPWRPPRVRKSLEPLKVAKAQKKFNFYFVRKLRLRTFLKPFEHVWTLYRPSGHVEILMSYWDFLKERSTTHFREIEIKSVTLVLLFGIASGQQTKNLT